MRAWPTSAERKGAVGAAPWRSRAAALALRPLAWLALQLQLLVLGLISTLWNLAALLLYPLLPRAAGRRVGRAMIAIGYGLFWRIARLSGMLRLQADVLDTLRDEAGLIVVANHPSMLDAVMLVAHLPRSACIMKSSLARNPFIGPGARLARYIRNDSAYGMVQTAVRDLREGGQLVMFPEGTRTTSPPVNAFHSSFALIAKRSQAPIQTVLIDTDSPYLGKGWPLWRLPPLPIRFSVRMGRRYAPSPDHDALRAEIQRYFAAELQPPRRLP
jgi:1-acyl-sn-glycerol-3-phosphate acyltransferase